jgi:hypothetical protein
MTRKWSGRNFGGFILEFSIRNMEVSYVSHHVSMDCRQPMRISGIDMTTR